MPCRLTAASLPGRPANPAAQGRGVLFAGNPYLSGGVCLSLQLIVNGISLGAVYALIAVGFALVFSILKFSNFAHGGMISAAAYIAYFFYASFETPPSLWVTLLFTAVVSLGVALLLDTLCYRRIRKNNSPNIYYFVASITFAILIEQILTVFFGKTSYGFPGMFEVASVRLLGASFATMDLVVLAVSIAMLVGEFGKGPQTVCRRYRKAGLENVQIKLYEGARHEILGELNRGQVWSDLLTWLRPF